MKFILLLFLFATGLCALGQENRLLEAKVVDANGSKPLPYVNVLNITRANGAVTNQEGFFSIEAKVSDTLFVSSLGYKSVKVQVTNDMFKIQTVISLTEMAYALEEVVVMPYKLTGDLYVDARNIPVNMSPRYSISGLPTTGYEVGGNLGVVGQTLRSISNPADFLYNTFSRKGRQLKKAREIRESNNLRQILSSKFDREYVYALLKITPAELETIIRNCNYSNDFVANANDLQLLEAISDCYEEYRVIKQGIEN